MHLRRLKAVLGLLLNMCLLVKPRLRDYWNMKDKWQRTPGFAEIISRDKFFACLRFMHFNDNTKAKPRGDPEFDPIFKIRPIVDHFNKVSSRLYSCDKYIAIDESLVGLKNRTRLIQYMPNKKHHRWGLKLWVLCESETGFVYRLFVYQGKEHSAAPSRFGQGYDVVMKLMEGLFNQGHVLVVDNFYTSVPLLNRLLELDTHCVGTLRRNRKYLPQGLKDAKLKPGEKKYWRAGTLLAVAFREKKSQTKPVLLISTCNKAADVKVTRASGKEAVIPEMVNTYNNNMGGVDLADQKIYTYQQERRSYKWYRKIFHNLLHRYCLNAYIIYCKVLRQRAELHQGDRQYNPRDYRPLTREQFLKSIINSLIGDYRDRGRPTADMEKSKRCALEKLPKERSSKSHKLQQRERECVVCSSKAARKRSSWKCSSCNVGVCRECFPAHLDQV